ncbi:gag-polypeptide of LTR copia-type domain-containing protein [Phthorimaea operculella]|nr:gag-polypeptide of LTR copia-type domain-containing protein [Phthorimaea operculella]
MENDSKQAYQPAFEKLDGVSNFGTWKFQMTMYLKLEDLWSCIEMPEDGVVDPKKDIKALARISLALKSTCIQYVRTVKTAKAAWDALCGVFEDKGFYRRVMLLRQLHQASYSNFNTMDNYIEYIMNLVHQLADIGRTIDDQEVAELLLSGLPQEYDIVVSSLESATVSKNLTSELVRTRLLQEEHRKKNNDKNDAMAFATKKKPLICHFCHRPGHVKAKCYKYKKNKKQESATEQAFVATHQCLSTANSSEWLLDSGATAHMSNDLKWFSNIKKCKQTVSVANGATLTCYGRGEEQTRSDLGVKDDALVLQSSHDVDAALVRPPSKVLQRPMMMETMRSEQTL